MQSKNLGSRAGKVIMDRHHCFFKFILFCLYVYAVFFLLGYGRFGLKLEDEDTDTHDVSQTAPGNRINSKGNIYKVVCI